MYSLLLVSIKAQCDCFIKIIYGGHVLHLWTIFEWQTHTIIHHINVMPIAEIYTYTSAICTGHGCTMPLSTSLMYNLSISDIRYFLESVDMFMQPINIINDTSTDELVIVHTLTILSGIATANLIEKWVL